MKDMLRKFNSKRAEDFWRISGSFGVVSGTVEENELEVAAKRGQYAVRSAYTEDGSGVVSRIGKLVNTSNAPFSVNCFMSKFLL